MRRLKTIIDSNYEIGFNIIELVIRSRYRRIGEDALQKGGE